MPLTTRPLSTSRQGMMRLASTILEKLSITSSRSQSFSAFLTQPPGSSPDETALHKYFSPPQLTHNARHTQSRLRQPSHPQARSKTNARNNRTLHSLFLQTTRAAASDKFDSSRHAARP